MVAVRFTVAARIVGDEACKSGRAWSAAAQMGVQFRLLAVAAAAAGFVARRPHALLAQIAVVAAALFALAILIFRHFGVLSSQTLMRIKRLGAPRGRAFAVG